MFAPSSRYAELPVQFWEAPDGRSVGTASVASNFADTPMAGHSENPLSHVVDHDSIELPWFAPPLFRSPPSSRSGDARAGSKHVLGAWSHALDLEVEESRGIEPENVALGLIGEERQSRDR